LGIGYIAALLQKEGFRVCCLNLYMGLKDTDPLIELIVHNQPAIIGFSTMTENFQNGVLLAQLVKDHCPNAIIVFGGPHITFLDDEALLKNSCIDIAVRGEGEFTMLELANLFIRGIGVLWEIKGISYREDGKIVRTPARPLLKDLDILPFPVREIPSLDKTASLHNVRNSVITSRGCPGHCKFCAASALAGGRYRKRSINNIAEEIESLKSRGLDFINFGDDTISADLSRLLVICHLLKEIGMRWSCESRVDIMTRELAIILANSGCTGIQFGVESGSQKLLDEMGKDITIAQVEQAVDWCSQAGMRVVCSMMIGVPGDTEDTIRQTISFAERLQRKYRVGVIMGCTVPYPGTYYYRMAEKLGIHIATDNYNLYSTVNPIMDTPYLTRWQVRNLYYDAILQLFKSLSRQYRDLFARMSQDSLAQAGYSLQTNWSSRR